jgi:cell division protein FtsL
MLGRTALTHPSPGPRARSGARSTKKAAVQPVPSASDRRTERPHRVIDHSGAVVEVPSVREEPTSELVRFILVLAVVCGLTCVYVWQTSTITDIRDETVALQEKLDDLEQDNLELTLQLTPLEDPAYIEAEADKLGLASDRSAIVVEAASVPPPAENQPTTATAYASDQAAGWWPNEPAQRLLAWLFNLAKSHGIGGARNASRWEILMRGQPDLSQAAQIP